MLNTRFSMNCNSFSTKAGLFDLILNIILSLALRDKKCFIIWILNVAPAIFICIGCHYRIRGRQRNFIIRLACNRWCGLFWDIISKHCKWIMICGPTFINDIGHKKTLKISTRSVDFGIPTIKIFLNKKWYWCTLGVE